MNWGNFLTRRSVSYRKADVQSRIFTFSHVLVDVPALCGSRISVDPIRFFDISIYVVHVLTYTYVSILYSAKYRIDIVSFLPFSSFFFIFLNGHAMRRNRIFYNRISYCIHIYIIVHRTMYSCSKTLLFYF